MNEFIHTINNFLVTYVLVFVLIAIGITFTIYLALPQFKYFKQSIKESFQDLFSKDKKNGISALQAMMISISAQVGTGNIIGVATAISLGGAGAIFWMWVSAFFGMATILAEGILAQKYKVRKDGHYIGGPAFYIKLGVKKILGKKVANALSVFFAIAIIIALGCAGQMTQSNSIAGALKEAFNIENYISGIVVAIVAAFVVIGGVKRIARFAEIVVPFMAICYVLVAIFVMIKFHSHILDVLSSIVKQAFGLEEVIGGAAGIGIKEAIRYGVARGLFANEAGMGSTPHAHASAHTKNTVSQGFVAMLAVFIDTAFICTATALIILLSGADLKLSGILLSTQAFYLSFGDIGVKLLAICLVFFAFTTIIGWYYFAQINVLYLFNSKALKYFKAIFVFCIFFGSLLEIKFVWELSDLCNTLMVLPNAIALFLLAKVVKQELKKNNF
ncbi:alanine/glycine:cation symporter family protein [Campylobacter canadensis]|uniref:Sodium:alanine symporter family protein n=1 Tax=Campylobacter canadensis TaxID=449520 RepID=A0ABS7WU43_9BACT|nr:sodium:alanine symporter family protein [Campylobacter canadensis]MBZ7987470.1 sodium:alanine symporter family protein [Campylobacter canadensis]MBZ7994813.1 sodium:alanine symporter family protein [Campylobacter canadensis]MBZ7996402.1 sodium:alanine symporter family protein [Campylobacter canadensis]MBZ7998436.1 sodium:alanine symporter family protein [Campylobacter canadensis]MBZ8000150.1 sodium:alanine symporter family protein [Campylobacter canadensis]